MTNVKERKITVKYAPGMISNEKTAKALKVFFAACLRYYSSDPTSAFKSYTDAVTDLARHEGFETIDDVESFFGGKALRKTWLTAVSRFAVLSARIDDYSYDYLRVVDVKEGNDNDGFTVTYQTYSV